MLAVDVYRGHFVTERWQSYSAFQPDEFIAAYENEPLAAVVVTDIDQQDAQLGRIANLARKTRHPVIARGTIHAQDDVARLKYISNISGAMIGRALMSRDIDLRDVLVEAQPLPERRAEFT